MPKDKGIGVTGKGMTILIVGGASIPGHLTDQLKSLGVCIKHADELPEQETEISSVGLNIFDELSEARYEILHDLIPESKSIEDFPSCSEKGYGKFLPHPANKRRKKR